jgi:hypothetical protein
MKRLNKISFLALTFFFLLGCEGDVGPAGFDSLVNTTEELSGLNCLVGGVRIDIGPDSNRNGVLDGDEIKSTKYVCNGAGHNSLVKTSPESVGSNCSEGGIKVDSGIDLNNNGTLEQNEVQYTQFVCNGANGLTVDQVRFQLVSLTGLGTSSTTGDLAPGWQYLRNFKKSNFSLMNSAILSANISTEGTSTPCITIVDLYNLTDNVSILGSEVTTNSITRVWVDSNNFLNSLPDKEIDLAIRLRTDVSGGFATCVQAHLILSKN